MGWDVSEAAVRPGRRCCGAVLCELGQAVDAGEAVEWGRGNTSPREAGTSGLGIFLTQLHTDLSNPVRTERFSCFKEDVGLGSHTEVPSNLKRPEGF